MQKREYTTIIGGKPFIATFSDLADQANGSVFLRYGNTIVFVTAVMSADTRDGLDYFPLTVDYEERFYAAGQILGSRFVRREGRPSDEAVLSGRVVDRTIRPLFNRDIRNDVQVVVTILSIDEDDPDILAVNAASLALATSDIPWGGPVSAVRIAQCADSPEFVINPSYAVRNSDSCILDMVACGKEGRINMIEVGAREVSETTLISALERAAIELTHMQTFQDDTVRKEGKEKRTVSISEIPSRLAPLFSEHIDPFLEGAIFRGPGKEGIHELAETWRALAREKMPDVPANIALRYYDDAVNRMVHTKAIGESRRPDGRSLDEIRPLYAEAGNVSPMLHGTGIFYRGGTHVLSALTLGGPGDSLFIDGMETRTKKRFMHHYNFPPFAPGETGRVGGFNRRQIGHGALAEKALAPLLPPKETFPYTIRIVSECMASNGSTSMASVCASSLALMDAGVPMVRPVAGIASGLMMESAERYVLLTDIQGPEDEHGDMDFKVAGTREGVTAIQMDVKVEGIPLPILGEALEKARVARLAILDVMERAIPAARAQLSPAAPQIIATKILPSQIGLVIGSGGKTVNEIRELTGTDIDIEEDGTVFITGKGDGPEKAKKIIDDMTRVFVPGERLTGIVTKVVDFGAFVKIGHNAEGLVHVSEIAPFRVANVHDFLREGQEVPVVVKESNNGKVSLSIKQADSNLFSARRQSDKP